MKTEAQTLILACAISLVLAMPPLVKAGAVGRYQLIAQDDLILVVDTQEGHLWQWQSFVQANANIVYDTTYLGKMRPGNNAGDLVDTWTWTVEEWRKRTGLMKSPE